MRELRVGYVLEPSAMRRSFICAAPYCRYVRVGDWYRALARAGELFNRCAGRELLQIQHLEQLFRERRPHAGVDLLHLFNQINCGRRPWLASFENPLPRLGPLLDEQRGMFVTRGENDRTPEQTRSRQSRRSVAQTYASRAVAALASDSCRRLLALSRNAAETQAELLCCALPALGGPLANATRCRAAIAHKTTVLPPPQPRLLAHIASKPPLADRALRVLFIADDPVRAGVRHLLDALLPLTREHPAALELTIVGPITVGRTTADERAFAAEQTPGECVRAVRALLEANRDCIRQHDTLEAPALLQLMRDADVGVLPDHSDHYGFVALQLQAAGCPVISTDVHALPEINDERRGWLIDVPKNRLGAARCADVPERQRLAGAIREGLTRCLRQILADRTLVRVRGERALQKIESEHDPARLGERLFDIYLECIVASPARPDAASRNAGRRVDL